MRSVSLGKKHLENVDLVCLLKSFPFSFTFTVVRFLPQSHIQITNSSLGLSKCGLSPLRIVI